MSRRVPEMRSATAKADRSASAAEGLNEVLERIAENRMQPGKPRAKTPRDPRMALADDGGQD